MAPSPALSPVSSTPSVNRGAVSDPKSIQGHVLRQAHNGVVLKPAAEICFKNGGQWQVYRNEMSD